MSFFRNRELCTVNSDTPPYNAPATKSPISVVV